MAPGYTSPMWQEPSAEVVSKTIMHTDPEAEFMVAGADATLRLEDTTLRSNGAIGSGGGLYVREGAVEVSRSVFADNSVGQGDGGGAYVLSSEPQRFDRVSFLNNAASDQGGGLYTKSSNALITNSLFVANTLYYDTVSGTAIYSDSGSETIVQCVFIGNVNRENNSEGSAYSSIGTNSHVQNSILWSNGGFTLGIGNEGQFSVSHSVIQGGYPGDSILSSNPLFVREPSPGPDGTWGTDDDDYGDLRLRWDSPAVDAGDASLLPADVLDLDGDGDTTEPLPLDADGNARVQGTAVDLGAYESPFNVAAEEDVALPAALALAAAPNPFARASTVTLALPAASDARVAAYDVLGREVAVLHDGPLAAGRHPMALGDGLAPGLYLVRATVDNGATTVRVTKSR